MKAMQELKGTYTMKGVGKPMYYLGGDVIELGPEWEKEGIQQAFSAETYITNILPKLAKSCGLEVFRKFNTPFMKNTIQSWMRQSSFQLIRFLSTSHCWEVLYGSSHLEDLTFLLLLMHCQDTP